MKKQVFYIHGGTAFSRYEDFLEWLRTCEVNEPIAERTKLWPATLREELGDGFEVFTPTMPNKQNAKYEEWKLWFERHIPFLRDGVALVGWSQGGYFLLKYLSENELPVAPRALYLVASPAGPGDFGGEDGGDFAFEAARVGNAGKQAEETVIFHSKDDPVVSFTHAERLAELLPKAELIAFEDRGHFLQEHFPELVERLQAGVD
jgi:predicted alpha/beta hydrolase family esterase